MLYIDLKYVKLLSPKLLRFTQVGQHAYRFRCPLCGDSKKNASKIRGNIFESGGKLNFKCFNCHVPMSFAKLINHLDPYLYREYILEKYRGESIRTEEPIFKKEEVKLLTDATIEALTCVTDLPEDHFAAEYVKSRKIPENKLNRIFFTEKYKTWVNSILPGKFNEKNNNNPRLVFPYFNKHGKVFAANARAFDDEEPKYIITKFDTSYDTIYGLDTVDWGRHVFVVEGQIDSLFLPNCLAVSGSSFDVDTIRKIKTNCTLIMDNERRNPQILKLITKYISQGYNVCLFPDTFMHKDINDAVLGGMNVDQITKIIRKNTYQGLVAELKFTEWRK